MIDCPQCQDRLADYLGANLTAVERAEVQVHLAGCLTCRLELELETRLEAWLWKTPVGSPPPGFADRVLARARREGLLTAPGTRWRAPARAFGASMAAALLGAYGYVSLAPYDLLSRAANQATRLLAWTDSALARLPRVSDLPGALALPRDLGPGEVLAAGAVLALIAVTWAAYEIACETA
jgi:hypothetical protein